MIRGILAFVVLWLLFFGTFSTWRSWTPIGAWQIGKAIALSAACSLAAVAFLALIVYLF